MGTSITPGIAPRNSDVPFDPSTSTRAWVFRARSVAQMSNKLIYPFRSDTNSGGDECLPDDVKAVMWRKDSKKLIPFFEFSCGLQH